MFLNKITAAVSSFNSTLLLSNLVLAAVFLWESTGRWIICCPSWLFCLAPGRRNSVSAQGLLFRRGSSHLCLLLTRSDKNFIWMVNQGINRWIVNVTLIQHNGWHGPGSESLISNELSCLLQARGLLLHITLQKALEGTGWKKSRKPIEIRLLVEMGTSILVQELWCGRSLLWQPQLYVSPKIEFFRKWSDFIYQNVRGWRCQWGRRKIAWTRTSDQIMHQAAIQINVLVTGKKNLYRNVIGIVFFGFFCFFF